jgi:3-deoxy-manno-octulosonate cytidylyltransferase (CMP-KDO synthetase)
LGVIAIIPARFASTRFPGKLLAKQTGKYLIQHVYETVKRAQLLESIVVATDDERIARACDQFKAPWCMTRADHQTGTDRIAEAAAGMPADIILNVQGDEPEIDPAHIDRLIESLQADPRADLATLSAAFTSPREIENPHIVKVVTDRMGHALYFSRCPIPYRRDNEPETPNSPNNQNNGPSGQAGPSGDQDTPPGGQIGIFRKHLGIYAYRHEALVLLSKMPPTPLEKSEKLEQLRALENGLVIAVARVEHHSVGIDTPQQYADFVRRFKEKTATEKYSL